MRKFLVVVDETPECMNAMRFAARRAQNTGGGVVMLYVIAPDDFQHWVGVAELMQAANAIGGSHYRYLEPYTMVGIIFLAISLPAAGLIKAFEAWVYKKLGMN